jgi:hypothetical protein
VTVISLRAVKIEKFAKAWGVQHPQLKSRIERARLLVDNVRAVAPKPDGSFSFLIEGSHGTPYIVGVDATGKVTSCTCPDAGRAVTSHCKHQIAVALRQAIRDPRPKGPRAFENEIRKWARDKEPPMWWIEENGLFAVRLLLQEIDRLRDAARKQRKAARRAR